MQEVFLTMMYERILIPSSDGYELPLDVYCPHVSVEIDPDIRAACGGHLSRRRLYMAFRAGG